MNSAHAKEKVLLVEDTHAMHLVVESLIGTICDLTCVPSLQAADLALKSTPYALLLLDVVLPDGSGFDFCESLRRQTEFETLPIVFLTSKNDVDDRVRGFDLGADDYVVKPLEPNEFLARVKAKLSRQRIVKMPPNSFAKGEFKIDIVSQKAYLGERDLGLTPIEFKLFSLFLKNEGKVHSRADLKKFVWGPAIHLSDHTVDTHVSSLRKKLLTFSGCLKSVVKTGYIFNLAISPKPSDA